MLSIRLLLKFVVMSQVYTENGGETQLDGAPNKLIVRKNIVSYAKNIDKSQNIC